jgi:hypothetical protein
MSTDLQLHQATVVDRLSGEILTVADATTEQLAQFVTNQRQVRDDLSDAEAAVSAELVARLDANAQWTLRVGDPTDVQWEITAPSPTAGSESYPPDMLEVELLDLVEAGTITPYAAAKALKRQVTLKLDVPLNLPLKGTADSLAQLTLKLGENELPITGCDYSASASKTGINALSKVPGVKDALDRARVTQPVGTRKAKVTLKERGR